ncbi:MAG TPA: sigma-70 family RNA polymerase sigma factor [Balneolaceae bacterium]|nr:sigma-70 family RNA polymerase sigma factor [Balneolaceae bacterium]
MLNWFKNKKEEAPEPPYSNEQWVQLLSKPTNDRAVEELRRLLVLGLKPALYKYVDRELEQFVEDVAQDGLIKILDNIATFRGESQFMTWAMKIAVREGLTELRRKRWQNISIENLKGGPEDEQGKEIFSDTFASGDVSPELATAQKMAVEKIEKMIDELLTERQSKAMRAILIHNIPISIVAEQMGTNRNNMYKLLYDARKKLKNELEVQGIDPEKLLNELSES